MSQQTLYLFIGTPGSGKTTVANIIHDLTGAVHLWADQERQAMFDKVTHSKSESEALYGKLNQQTDDLLKTGKSVVFDTNFNYKKDRDYVREIATRSGASTVVIWMQTPLSVARERALHSHHRDRNGYDDTMTATDFDKLVDHLEPPEANEKFIIINGSDLDENDVRQHLGL